MCQQTDRTSGASDLREDQVLRAAAVQAQDEADGLEEVLDAGSELVLLHPAGGSGVQDPGLDDELEEVLQGLRGLLAERRRRHNVRRCVPKRRISADCFSD